MLLFSPDQTLHKARNSFIIITIYSFQVFPPEIFLQGAWTVKWLVHKSLKAKSGQRQLSRPDVELATSALLGLGEQRWPSMKLTSQNVSLDPSVLYLPALVHVQRMHVSSSWNYLLPVEVRPEVNEQSGDLTALSASATEPTTTAWHDTDTIPDSTAPVR